MTRLGVGRGHRRRSGAPANQDSYLHLAAPCSRWPTAWAATAPARWPPSWPPSRCASEFGRRPTPSSPPTSWSGPCSGPTTRWSAPPPSDPELAGMGTTLCALALVESRRATSAWPSSTWATRGSTCSRRAISSRSPTTTAWWPPSSARAASPRTRPPSTPSATSSPGPWASTPGSWSTRGRCGRCRATATCCAATACSTRWTRAGSRPRCASWPHPTRRPTSWCAWPTRAAAATTSPWSWSTCEGDADDATGRRHRRPTSTAAGGRSGDRSTTGSISAVSGETRAIGDQDEPPPEPRPAASSGPPGERRRRPPTGPRPRHFTWRVLAFVVAVAVIIGLTVAAITYYARDTYYVGFDGDTVVDLPGPPGRGAVDQARAGRADRHRPAPTVPASLLAEIDSGKVEPTLADAHRYLTNVHDVASTQGPPAATTSSTTAAGLGTTTAARPPPGTDRRWASAGATPSWACW